MLAPWGVGSASAGRGGGDDLGALLGDGGVDGVGVVARSAISRLKRPRTALMSAAAMVMSWILSAEMSSTRGFLVGQSVEFAGSSAMLRVNGLRKGPLLHRAPNDAL